VIGRTWRRRPRECESGQSLVEVAISIPVVMVMLLSMLEFGFVFSHHLTLEYATREGARAGAAFANGNADINCSGSPNVDHYVVSAVQRVLEASGAQIPIAQVKEIRLFRATSTGGEVAGDVDVWVPTGSGITVDGLQLKFARTGGSAWSACGRDNVGPIVDSIGVGIVYDYQLVTPIGAALRLTGGGDLRISDRTIMALNPD
jgi:hypothetical protein